jgi:hypothetical protein
MDIDDFQIEELIEYFNEECAKLSAPDQLAPLNLYRAELSIIITALHHYLESDDRK